MNRFGLQMPSGVGHAAQPLLRLVSNAELEEREKPVVAADTLPGLVAYIRRCWEQARRAKERVQKEILEDYRQRDSQYDADKLDDIRKQGGSEIFLPLTDLKCSALQAWITDVMMPADDKAWDLDASPVTDLSPEQTELIELRVMQEARQAIASGLVVDQADMRARVEEMKELVKERMRDMGDQIAERMERVIEDEMEEGGWEAAFAEAIYDFVTTKACIIHGPVLRRKKRLQWARSYDGTFHPVEEPVVRKEYRRVSPLDIYPSPDSNGLDDGFLFHHQRLTPGDFHRMIGVKGFDEGTIRQIIEDYGSGGLKEWMWHDTQRAVIEQKDQAVFENAEHHIDTLVFYGPVLGKLLSEWGLPCSDPHEEYEVSAWLVGRHLTGVRLNDMPGGMRPYVKASMEEIPGAFWGKGLARKIRHQQAMCNATGRAIANDMGLTSMFQVSINDVSRIPPEEDVTSIFPGKIWQFLANKTATTNIPPISFFQPTSNAAALIRVFEFFSAQVDEIVPSYFNGNQNVGGAGSTASGLSMLLSQATKFVKQAVKNMDSGVVNRAVKITYLLNMLYHKDQSIKGDLHVVARGAVALLVKEQQQVRRNEFLAVTNNPVDLQIIGLEGRAAVLRETARSLDIPIDDVVPDADSFKAKSEQAAVEQKVQAMMTSLAGALGMAPEALMQMAQGQQPQQLQPSRTLDAAGMPVSGQDARQFN